MNRLIIFSTGLLFLSACGSNNGPKYTTASGTITQALATSNKSTLQSGAKLTFTGTPTNSPGSVRDDNALDACTTKTPATALDADSDGVKTQTRVYACTNVATTRASTATVNGTVTVTDTDDSDPKSGWKFAYDMTGKYVGTSQTNNYEYKGFWELVKDATSYTYSSDYKGTSSEVTSRTTYTSGGGGTWSHKVTPVDMANPYAGGGSLEFSGFYAYLLTADSVSTEYVFKMSSSGLKYGAYPGCAQYFSEGSFTYTDASNNTVKYTYTNCTTPPVVTYNATTI